MWQFASFQVQVALFVCASGTNIPELNYLFSIAQHDLALRSKENIERIIIYVQWVRSPWATLT